MILVKRLYVQIPLWVLAEFKSQLMGWNPNLSYMVSPAHGRDVTCGQRVDCDQLCFANILLQEIFPTQGSNLSFLCLLCWQAGSLLVPPSSVQFSRSVVSDSLQPHESQHTVSLSISNSLSLPKVMSIKWVMPSSHLILCRPFSSCPQSLPASGYFPVSHLFTWGGQGTGVSASASFLPMNTQDWFPLGWTGWISLQS